MTPVRSGKDRKRRAEGEEESEGADAPNIKKARNEAKATKAAEAEAEAAAKAATSRTIELDEKPRDVSPPPSILRNGGGFLGGMAADSADVETEDEATQVFVAVDNQKKIGVFTSRASAMDQLASTGLRGNVYKVGIDAPMEKKQALRRVLFKEGEPAEREADEWEAMAVAVCAMHSDVRNTSRWQLKGFLDDGLYVDARTVDGETLMLYGLRVAMERHFDDCRTPWALRASTPSLVGPYLSIVRMLANRCADAGAADNDGDCAWSYLLRLPYADVYNVNVYPPESLMAAPNKDGVTPVSTAVHRMVALASAKPVPCAEELEEILGNVYHFMGPAASDEVRDEFDRVVAHVVGRSKARRCAIAAVLEAAKAPFTADAACRVRDSLINAHKVAMDEACKTSGPKTLAAKRPCEEIEEVGDDKLALGAALAETEAGEEAEAGQKVAAGK